jgi:hypothetical protein
MDRNWIDRWLETAPTRNVKRARLFALRPFFQWTVSPMGLIEHDPTMGIKVKAGGIIGHATWTDEQIAQFRSYHQVGSKARLALELLLNLASRRGDGISLGRQHVKDGWLIVWGQCCKRPATSQSSSCMSLIQLVRASSAARPRGRSRPVRSSAPPHRLHDLRVVPIRA